jgi:uncharacterized protein
MTVRVRLQLINGFKFNLKTIVFFICLVSGLLAGCERKALMSEKLPPIEKSSLEFTCVTELDTHVPLDKEADEWFKKARRIEKGKEQGTDIDVNALLFKAIERNHWKALPYMSLRYATGAGIEQDTDKAIDLAEKGMKLNMGRAYAQMGNLLAEGLGVKMDSGAALAYHRKAADLGVTGSQTLIGDKFFSLGQSELGEKFLLCALNQGWAPAAFKLAGRYMLIESPNFDQAKALKYLQKGVELGDQKSSNFLRAAFEVYEKDKEQIINLKVKPDAERARRYNDIYKAIDKQPGIQFPRIDTQIPLPPKSLPTWRGAVGVMPD